MKKIFIIIGIILIVVLIALGIWLGWKIYQNKNLPTTTTAQSNGNQINITEANKGQTINLKVGQKLKVNLRDPGDGGYKFADPQYNKSILNLIDYQNIKPTSGAMGDFGHDEWTYQAISAGQTNLKYEIFRSWETGQNITQLETIINVGS